MRHWKGNRALFSFMVGGQLKQPYFISNLLSKEMLFYLNFDHIKYHRLSGRPGIAVTSDPPSTPKATRHCSGANSF